MYDDARAAGIARRVGSQMQATWALPKLLWMLEHVDGAQAARVYHCPDFIATWLAGEPVAADWSHALKTGYDLLQGRWPHELFEELGVPSSALPPVVRPGTLLGHVSPEGEAATGLPHRTPLRAGMTDGCAAQIAAGTL